jgi:uncharacterized membrane protein YbhN (UPF0104 family)
MRGHSIVDYFYRPEERLLRASLWKAVRIGVNLILCLWGASYVYLYRHEFEILLTVRWHFLLLIAGAITLNSVANAAQTAALFSAFGARMSIGESFGLSNIGNAVSLFLPQGTTITKAAYMKHRYGVSFSATPAIFLGSLVTYLLVAALLLLLSSLIAALNGHSVPEMIWMIAAAISAPVALFWLDIPERWMFRLGRVGQLMRQIATGWKTLRSNRRCLFQVALFQLCDFVTTGATVSIAFYSIGITVNIWTGLTIVIFVSLLNLIQVTPGNLGVQEAGFGFFSQLYGYFFLHGVVVSGLSRTVALLLTVCIAPIAWYWLFFRQKINLREA